MGQIIKKEITETLEKSYLDYAMSVIVSRALPDVRDGLKPVQRRILYAMYKLGLKSGAKFRKSATVVGEVLGKYHPHGDMPVYDALTRMTQDFSMRYPLIYGQGNFGSIDGDAPAAMRYTEVKMTKMAEEMLEDIEKETVDFVLNYDNTLKEPAYLPSKLPQLLLNGVKGIAVGMATSIPPHNLKEIADAAVYLIDNPDCTSEDLLNFIKGPDFPTGGIIYDRNAILKAYGTGKGAIPCRAKTEIKDNEIIIKELVYQTNKANLIQKIADLVKEDKIKGIKDIRDESDKNGISIKIEVKKGFSVEQVLKYLFKYTELEQFFYVNFLALVDGVQPKVLSIREIISEFIKHRQIIWTRKAQFDLKEAQARVHILEGLSKALDYIDAIIKVIKSSKTREEAALNLIKKFQFTSIQAEAILQMQLARLAGLERKKILDELEQKRKIIAYLKDLLAHPKKILAEIKKEIKELAKFYGDERKTKVIKGKFEEVAEEDLVIKEETLIIGTDNGYVKRISPKLFKVQARGGKGILGILVNSDDKAKHLVYCQTTDDVFILTNDGVMFVYKAYEIPDKKREQKGDIILQKPISVIVTKKYDIAKEYFVFITKYGKIKKTKQEEFTNISRGGLIAVKIAQDDVVKFLKFADDKDFIFIATKFGKIILFSVKNISEQGRYAGGVKGIRLEKGDEVIGAEVIGFEDMKKSSQILVITEKGLGKKVSIKEFSLQGRGGAGRKLSKVNKKTGAIKILKAVKENSQELLIVSEMGQIMRTEISKIPVQGRYAQGVIIMKFDLNDKVADAVIL